VIDRAIQIAILGVAILAVTPVLPMAGKREKWRRMGYVVGALLIAIAAVTYFFPDTQSAGMTITNVGSGNCNVAGSGNQVNCGTTLAHADFQSINTAPPSLGGNTVLNLGDIATLHLDAPFNLTSITMRLNVVPVYLPKIVTKQFQAEGEVFYHGHGEPVVFDVNEQQRKLISVYGYSFVVTLKSVKSLTVAGVGYAPIEYDFAIMQQ
jgi:hypothetical protein